MKAIIIEDEKANISKLKRLLATYCKQVNVVGEALNADDGICLIGLHQPDLVFLDIQMRDKTGFEMLAELGTYEFEVIFVTGYEQYGIQAIKFSALDYLVKPVKATELTKAVLKAESKSQKKQAQEQIVNLLNVLNGSQKKEHLIGLPLMKEIRYVNPEDVIRCESINNYTKFHLQSKESILVTKAIAEFEKLLSNYGFIRCHQSHLVNKKYIKSLFKEDNVSELLLNNDVLVPVSRLKREEVKEKITK
jgi:two-component system LytT family response regulator